jgi:hypothetical protein
MVIKLIKGIIRLWLIVLKINWFKLIRLYSKDADTLLWVPRKSLLYLVGDAIIWDFATLNAFAQSGKKFRIFYGNKIGKSVNKVIYHTINRNVNEFKFRNYTAIYEHLTMQLERQGNTLIPSSREVRFWENKGYMHSEFERLQVSEPKTKLIPLAEFDINCNLDFPYLIKTEHSCSAAGVFKISSKEILENLLNDKDFRIENETVIKQELINMRKDLRVILVGNEIVHFYWRVNKSAEWKPTSTSYGSDVDFVFFPENWRSHIIETFQKLGLASGAFDITWRNDDLDGVPFYLEVSPVYQPNPRIDLRGKPYASYKKGLSPFNEYDNNFVDLIFIIKQKQYQCINRPIS